MTGTSANRYPKETDDVIHYKIDTKEDVVFDSTEPEVANEFTTDINQRQIAWKTVKESGSIYEEYTTHLQYETPGGVVGTIYQNDRDRFIEDSGSFRGSCEASNKSAYEAPQKRSLSESASRALACLIQDPSYLRNSGHLSRCLSVDPWQHLH